MRTAGEQAGQAKRSKKKISYLRSRRMSSGQRKKRRPKSHHKNAKDRRRKVGKRKDGDSGLFRRLHRPRGRRPGRHPHQYDRIPCSHLHL